MSSTNAVQTHPDWLIDATGSREAHDAWRRAEADALPLLRAHREAIAAQTGTARWQGTPGNAFMAPARDISTADFERLRAAAQSAGDAVAAANRKIGRAKKAFDTLLNSGDAGARNRIAASVALAEQSTAAAAWETLKTSLTRRDEAYRFAGSPGQRWQVVSFLTSAQATEATEQASYLLSRRIGDFPVQAVTDIAEAD
jgi:hypothetical protein